MPFKDPEKKKEYMRKYAENNREKIYERNRLFYQNNKDIKSYYQRDTYKDIPSFKKTHTISNWKTRGVIGDYDELYEQYINTTECNVCKFVFTDKNWKCLDHDHTNGQFRYILCNNCNMYDRWKKHIID